MKILVKKSHRQNLLGKKILPISFTKKLSPIPTFFFCGKKFPHEKKKKIIFYMEKKSPTYNGHFQRSRTKVLRKSYENRTVP